MGYSLSAGAIASFRARLDLDRIRRALSAADGTDYPAEYVVEFLTSAGFIPDPANPGHWLVTEENLSHVRTDEVLSIEPVKP
jgi:hypothetical protein